MASYIRVTSFSRYRKDGMGIPRSFRNDKKRAVASAKRRRSSSRRRRPKR